MKQQERDLDAQDTVKRLRGFSVGDRVERQGLQGSWSVPLGTRGVVTAIDAAGGVTVVWEALRASTNQQHYSKYTAVVLLRLVEPAP